MIREHTIKFFVNIAKVSVFTTRVYMARFGFKKIFVKRKAIYLCTDEQIKEFRDFANLMREKRNVRRYRKANKRS